jgi:hypothetical protein
MNGATSISRSSRPKLECPGKIRTRRRPTSFCTSINVPCSGGGSPAHLEVDKLADRLYRATVGTLFERRTHDLEALVRQANVMTSCRSFDDVVRTIRAMRSADKKPPRLPREPWHGRGNEAAKLSSIGGD